MSLSEEQDPAALRTISPLLITESHAQFASLCQKIEHEIQSMGIIEQTYTADIVSLIWEIQRLRRCKTNLINNCYLAALRKILLQLLRSYDFPGDDYRDGIEDLARGYFRGKKAQARVAKLLRQYQMDESIIEAEAFKMSSEDGERINRMLAALEARRDRALRTIADYRQTLSHQLRQSSDRILDNDDVPRLVSIGTRSE